MKDQYKVAAALEQRFNQLQAELDTAIELATDAIATQSNGKVAEFDTSQEEIRVGEFETLIDGYPLVEAVRVKDGTLYLKLELLEDFEPIQELYSLSLGDKVEILKALIDILHNEKDK